MTSVSGREVTVARRCQSFSGSAQAHRRAETRLRPTPRGRAGDCRVGLGTQTCTESRPGPATGTEPEGLSPGPSRASVARLTRNRDSAHRRWPGDRPWLACEHRDWQPPGHGRRGAALSLAPSKTRTRTRARTYTRARARLRCHPPGFPAAPTHARIHARARARARAPAGTHTHRNTHMLARSRARTSARPHARVEVAL